MPDEQPKNYKTVECRHFKNGKCWDGVNCKFAHGKSELRPSEQSTSKSTLPPSKYKTSMCEFYKRKGGCFKGGRCLYAHSEEEKRLHLRLANKVDINDPKYKTLLCRHFQRGGSGNCTYGEKCLYIHPPTDTEEYAAYKTRMDAQWVPVRGDITLERVYESYAEAVRHSSTAILDMPTGPLPTHCSDGWITELNLMAVANGCSESRWTELFDIIAQGYVKLESLDTNISCLNESPQREHYSQKMASLKAERVEIENKLRDAVNEKNKWLNKDIVELHGFRHEQDAVQLVHGRLDDIRKDPTVLPANSLRPRTLTLITGAGNKSAGDPKILLAVLDLLGIHYDQPEMLNPGCIIVNLPVSWF